MVLSLSGCSRRCSSTHSAALLSAGAWGQCPGAVLPGILRGLALAAGLCRRPLAEAVAPFLLLLLSELFWQLSCPLPLLPVAASLQMGWFHPLLSLFAALSPEAFSALLPCSWRMLRPLSALHQTVLCCFMCSPGAPLPAASRDLHIVPDTSVLLREGGHIQEGAVRLMPRRGALAVPSACVGRGTS